MDYRHIITIEPGKRGGKPCIRGMRITVYDVLDYLASDMSIEEILRDFPDLTHEDIRACLAFAADRERRLMSISPAKLYVRFSTYGHPPNGHLDSRGKLLSGYNYISSSYAPRCNLGI